MFPGDSWETESGTELVAAAPDSFVVHNGDACQLTFDLACLLRPSQQQASEPQSHSQTLPLQSAQRRRSQSALEAEFSGTSVEQRLVGCGEVADSAFYARWLHVKSGCLADAKQSILDHCKWREESTAGGIKEADISNELAADKVFLLGADLKGRPVIMVLACRHQMRHRNLDETVRLIIYTLDNSAAIADTAINPLGQTLCLIDLSGLRMGNLDVEGLKALFDLLQRHYPERLAELWFLKAPFIFWGLWRIVSPFLAEGTRRKIRFMSSFDELQNSMSAEVLPERYGGKAQLISMPEIIAARRAGEAAAAQQQTQLHEAAQAARAAAAGGPITSRLSAAGSTVKRWGAVGFGFVTAKAAAAGRQTARPLSAIIAAYRRRQAAAPPRDGPPSPTLSIQLSANLDAAKAKARSIEGQAGIEMGLGPCSAPCTAT
ncbi:hypothetical protein WJX84_009180 [Apatococcus fuscideae]|uniref:CRAL-TRIO domain-containing protein n=1 Tax=Apatococcus fuscideae TaxID=2026836 RepID=A0AAW1SXB4_9CHLO